MNRRSFIAAIASLPVIGRFFKEKVPVPTPMPVPEVAYSVRKLTKGYEGPMLRLGPPGQPEQDIGFGTEFNPEHVVKWYDQSGNGKDIT